MQVNRRLYRCREDRRLGGVAAGVAEFFDLDPTLVRVLWFLSIFAGGFSILLYVGLWIIVPLEPLPGTIDPSADATAVVATGGPEGHRHATRGAGTGRVATFVGLTLILLGGLALVDSLVPSWTDSWRYLWPLFFLGIGTVLVATAVRGEPSES
jgi:phage shock protein C